LVDWGGKIRRTLIFSRLKNLCCGLIKIHRVVQIEEDLPAEEGKVEQKEEEKV
jgi:hypothetical protein